MSSLDRSLYNEVVWLKNFIEPQAKRIRVKKQRIKPKAQAPNEIQSSTQEIRKSDEVIVEAGDSTEFDRIWNQIYEHTLLSPKKQIIQIRDKNNDILYKSGLGKEELVFDNIPFNSTRVATIWNSSGQQLRLAVSQDQHMKVYVAYPLSEIWDLLGNLFSIFLYLIPVALLASIVGGYFLAVRSLKPVDAITAAARAITAHNLDQRIQHSGVDDELGRLVSTFNEMITRLKYSFEQIQQFSQDVSHELRTPLTIMRGEIELGLRTEQTSDSYKEILTSSHEEILRMITIIENLLTIAKGDRGTLYHEFHDVWLRPIMRELFEDSKFLAEQKQISISLIQMDDALIWGDSGQIRQLLLNLVENAIKYTPERGTVELSLIREQETAVIKVKDSGIGIPKEDQQKIFDRFYRVDKARTRERGGTGLGLSMVKWGVELHRGTISVESEIHQGSTFIITLPLKHEKQLQLFQ